MMPDSLAVNVPSYRAEGGGPNTWAGIRLLQAIAHWEPDEFVVTLTVYLDESGEHDSKGRLERLTIAGCVSTVERWLRLEDEWNAILQKEGVPAFHRNEFPLGERPNYRTPYRGWSQEKVQTFFDELLGCMRSHISHYVGAVGIPMPTDATAARRAYTPAAALAIARACGELSAIAPQEDVNFVFAVHPEVTECEMVKYVPHFRAALPRMGSISMDRPCKYPALQTADLVAYELRRHVGSGGYRYPLSALFEAATAFVE